jgi:hypothetical protein
MQIQKHPRRRMDVTLLFIGEEHHDSRCSQLFRREIVTRLGAVRLHGKGLLSRRYGGMCGLRTSGQSLHAGKSEWSVTIRQLLTDGRGAQR